MKADGHKPYFFRFPHDGVLLCLFKMFFPVQKKRRTQGKLRQEQAKGYGRKSHGTGKGQGELRRIDSGDGNLPAAVLGKLAHKNGFW